MFGERIYLIPDTWLPPDVQPPAITVGPAEERESPLTGGEVESEVTVRCHVIYNEWRSTIATTSKTARSALKVIRAAVWDNYTLRVPAFSMVPLVKRIVRTNPVTFGLFEAGDPLQVPRTLTLEFVFEKNLEAATGDSP